MKCVALKIQNGGGCSAADIINNLFKVEKKENKVYYATNIIFDKRRSLKKILFFFSYQGVPRYVLADIIDYKFEKNAFILNGSDIYSPTEYKNIENRSWFIIRSITEVDENFVSECIVEYDNGRRTKSLLNVINSQSRLNRVYFTKPSTSIDDKNILIK